MAATAWAPVTVHFAPRLFRSGLRVPTGASHPIAGVNMDRRSALQARFEPKTIPSTFAESGSGPACAASWAGLPSSWQACADADREFARCWCLAGRDRVGGE